VLFALQRNADDVKSSEDLVEFSQRLITEDMSQQMFTYAHYCLAFEVMLWKQKQNFS